MIARLVDRLGAERGLRVVPVAGPPGAGKTEAIKAALARVSSPAVHFRVRSRHPELISFVGGLVDELSTIAPSLALDFAAAAATAQRSVHPARVLAEWLARRLGEFERIVVAVDDLQLVSEVDAVRDFVVRAIENAEGGTCWLLCERTTDRWPVASWLARGITCVPVVFATDERYPQDLDIVANAAARAFASELGLEAAATLRAIALLPSLAHELVSRVAHATQLLASLVERYSFAVSGSRFRPSFERSLLEATAHVDSAARIFACEALRDAAPALRLQAYVDMEASDECVALLDSDGFGLIDDGYGDVVSAAIERLSSEQRRSCALAMTLEAKREAELGRHDVAESWFLHALKIAPTDASRTRVEWAYATDLLRRSRADAIEMLEHVSESSISPTFDAVAAATLGAAYAASDRMDAARSTLKAALVRVEGWPEDRDLAVRALVYRQAAYVALRLSDPVQAAVLARRAIAAAERCGLDEIVAPALSVLVVVATSHDDDPEEALDLLQRLEECALRLDNAYLLRYSRLAQLDAYGERAMWNDVDRIEALLASQELENDTLHADQTLVRTRALRAAGNGNFAAAVRVLQACTPNAADPELYALHHTELGTYAAACGSVEVASAAIAAASIALRPQFEPHPSALAIRTSLQLAVAELLLGNRNGARERLSRVGADAACFRRLRTLHAAVEQTLAYGEQVADTTSIAMLDSLAALHACDLGGFASVLGALPLARVERLVS